MLLDGDGRRACGGAIRLVVSALIEILLSALIAPIMMLIQSGSVFQILLGRDTGWKPQRRDDGSIPFARHRAAPPLAHGARRSSPGVSAFLIATSLFLWMSPTILGLVLAIPLSWLSGQLGAGLALKRLGLLLTPEETRPPADRRRAPTPCRPRNAALGFDDADALVGAPRRPALARSATRRCCPPRRRAGAARSTPTARRRGQAHRRRDDRGRAALAEAEGAHGRAARPRAARPPRPAAAGV